MAGDGTYTSPIVIDDDETLDGDAIVDPARQVVSSLPPTSPNMGVFSKRSESFDKDSEIECGVGHSILLRMGYQPGKGLGRDLEGPLDPIIPNNRVQSEKFGIGRKQEMLVQADSPQMSHPKTVGKVTNGPRLVPAHSEGPGVPSATTTPTSHTEGIARPVDSLTSMSSTRSQTIPPTAESPIEVRMPRDGPCHPSKMFTGLHDPLRSYVASKPSSIFSSSHLAIPHSDVSVPSGQLTSPKFPCDALPSHQAPPQLSHAFSTTSTTLPAPVVPDPISAYKAPVRSQSISGSTQSNKKSGSKVSFAGNQLPLQDGTGSSPREVIHSPVSTAHLSTPASHTPMPAPRIPALHSGTGVSFNRPTFPTFSPNSPPLLPAQCSDPFLAMSPGHLPNAPVAVSTGQASVADRKSSSASLAESSNGLPTHKQSNEPAAAASSSSTTPAVASRTTPIVINGISYRTHNGIIGVVTTAATQRARRNMVRDLRGPMPLPSRTLVIQAVPKKYRNRDFVDRWLGQFAGMPPVLRVEWHKEKLLIEFANDESKERAFKSRSIAGSDGLQTIRAYNFCLPLDKEPRRSAAQKAAVAQSARESLASNSVDKAPPVITPAPQLEALPAPLLASSPARAVTGESATLPLSPSLPSSDRFSLPSVLPSAKSPKLPLDPGGPPSSRLSADTRAARSVVRTPSSVEATLRAEVLSNRTRGAKRERASPRATSDERGTDSTSAPVLSTSHPFSASRPPTSGADNAARPAKRVKTSSPSPGASASHEAPPHGLSPRKRIDALIAEFKMLDAKRASTTVRDVRLALQERMTEIHRELEKLQVELREQVASSSSVAPVVRSSPPAVAGFVWPESAEKIVIDWDSDDDDDCSVRMI